MNTRWMRWRMSAVVVMAGLMGARAAEVYVAPVGQSAPEAPYNTWGKAANDIQTAVTYASTNYPAHDTVVVSNGTYGIGVQISITNAITVRSFAGAPDTVTVQGNGANTRVFNLSHADALLAGLTIRAGKNVAGAGVYMTGGTVSNCHLVANATGASQSGGGIWMSGGLVTGCLVASNTVSYNAGGGGIYMSGGLVDRSVIRGNKGSSTGGSSMRGAGVHGAGGSVRNCLIVDNDNTLGTADRQGGGVYLGTYENCTIARNRADTGGGSYGGTLINCIVYANQADITGDNYTGGAWSYSCTTPAPGGVSNITSDPLFLGADAWDFRLRPGAPAKDVGTNLAWMAVASDLAGNPRIGGSGPDMGCYEYATGPLACSFAGDPVAGHGTLLVPFTATVDGTNLSSVTYHWDFDGNGTTDVSVTSNTASHSYGLGLYTVSLTVSNAAGEGDMCTRPAYITVSPDVVYVWTNGTHTSPYTNWVTAATNLPSALALADGDTLVQIGDGTYSVESEILLDRGVFIRSENGPEHTAIARRAGTSGRVMTLAHSNAVLAGVTVRGGKSLSGAGVYMTGGTVSNCHIVANVTGAGQNGGGLWMSGGLVTGCLVVSNTVSYNGGGGGVYISGGRVENSVIRANKGSTAGSLLYGAGVYGSGGLVRNCLIVDNDNTIDETKSRVGGGVYGGVYQNCTIVNNRAGSSGGAHTATLTNCIVYANEATQAASHNYTGGTWGHSCTTPDPGGIENVVADPLFLNAAGGDYRLAAASLCIDKGMNDPAWMDGASDLAGNRRIVRSTVDIGAYEFMPPTGTMFMLR